MAVAHRGPTSRGLIAWLGRIVGAVAAGYLGYVSIAGSRRLVHPDARPLEAGEGMAATPAEVGLRYEDVRFTTDDGVTLSGWLIPAGRETRAAVIVMHGFSGHRLGELAAFVPWLQPTYHVLQFDFRGHGASDPSPITLGARERRDVAAAVRFLLDRGLGPIALLGVSMGASVALLAAPDLPVAAVVADAAYADLRNPVANRMRGEGYPLAGLGSRIILLAASIRARARLLSPLNRVAAIAPRGLLLIAPKEDRLIDYTESLRLYQAAREPKELFVVEGAEHSTARWVAGPEYERRVLSFLGQHL